MHELLDTIQKYKPDVLAGAPEYLALLARVALKHDLKIPSVKTIDVGHNHLWSVYKKVIEQAFGVQVSVRYHSSELGLIAITCPFQNMHLLHSNRWVELINLQGKAAKENEKAMLSYSSWDGQIRPQLRYLQGDVVMPLGNVCACKVPSQIIKLLGRAKDVILSHRGQWVSYQDLDDVLNQVDTFFMFQAELSDDLLKIQFCHVVDELKLNISSIKTQLENLYGVKVECAVVDFIGYPTKGKLLGFKNDSSKQTFLSAFKTAVM